jgi:hypothetical protein
MELPRNIAYKKIIIGSSGTITPFAATAYLCAAYLFVSNAGTGWSLKIQDKDPAGASLLYNPGAVAVTTAPISILTGFNLLPMIGGIDLITAGTPGNATVWLVYAYN